MANKLDLGVTAWSPLGGGVLTRKYARNGKKDYDGGIRSNTSHSNESSSKEQQGKTHNSEQSVSRFNVIKSHEMSNIMLKERNLLIAEEVSKVAKEIKCSAAQVAINWIRQQKLPRGSKIIPIIGARSIPQVKDNLGCLKFESSNEQLQRLNYVSKIELGFPHDFLAAEYIKDIIYGGTYSSIYNHRK